jgi:hypothetical protein
VTDPRTFLPKRKFLIIVNAARRSGDIPIILRKHKSSNMNLSITRHSPTSLVSALRVASAVASSALFGLLSAKLLPFDFWTSAFLLAFVFGFFFVGGTGYRILIAVALRDPSLHAAASWSGASAISGLAVLAAAAALVLADLDASLLLAAYALAINAAYGLVKIACLNAGCCQTSCRHQHLLAGLDLRAAEFAGTALVIILAAGLFRLDLLALAATVGLGGHLAIRFISRWFRDRMPVSLSALTRVGQELPILGCGLGFALFLLIRP